MRIAEQWLALGDDLPLELAKVLTPKEEWKHDFPETRDLYRPFIINAYGPCRKCRRHRMYEFTKCHLPDPIIIAWHMAIGWFRKYPVVVTREGTPLDKIWAITQTGQCLDEWLMYHAQPKHYLIAAAMAAEGSTE